MSVRLTRRGATLPLTILVIAILGVAVAISFARLSSERRITADGQAQVDAFTVAQSGLNNYLAGLNTKPGASDNATLNVPGGTAQISLRMLRDSIISGAPAVIYPGVYLITSRGTATGALRYDSRAPAAERSVATFALWTPAPLDVDAAFTSLSGIDKNGNSGSMSGVDACGAMASIPGVAVPNGGYTGHTNPINGNPDNAPKEIGTPGIAGSAKDSVGIDWAGIVNSNALPATRIYPDNPSWPPVGPDPTQLSMDEWPVIRVNGDLTLPGSGSGVLIVTGNLTIDGSNRWDGLVLVGGTFTSNGNNTIEGGLVTGLNVKLGMVVPETAIGNGNKTIQFSSCNLARALGRIGSLQRVRNGWTDTWSSY